jgi:cytochrome c-type biogenesis protein
VIAGVVIIVFSLQLIGLINISYLNFEKRIEAKKSQNILFPYVIGLAFGFGWTPCIGPILGSILALASIEETLSKAIMLLVFYSLGLAIPFTLAGYLIQKFLVFSKNFKKNINLISKIGGFTLLITGILILTNQLQTIGFYLIKIFPFMQNFG